MAEVLGLSLALVVLAFGGIVIAMSFTDRPGEHEKAYRQGYEARQAQTSGRSYDVEKLEKKVFAKADEVCKAAEHRSEVTKRPKRVPVAASPALPPSAAVPAVVPEQPRKGDTETIRKIKEKADRVKNLADLM